MNIRLAIADGNEEYLNRLVSVLEEYDNLSFSIYTDRKSLEKALSEKTFDVLLFDVSVYEGQVSPGKKTLGIMLSDETGSIPAGCKNFPRIKKYQRISGIYKKILELYAEICGDISVLQDGKKAKTVAFYSPAGGTGKTTAALAAAARLAMAGYRTFYMNLEDVASQDCYLPQGNGKGITEMLSCMGTGTSFSMKLQGLLQTKTENLFYLNHFDTPNDIYELRPEELTELIASIFGTGLFDFLVVDMGISMDEKALRVFESADQIVILEKPDAMASKKLETFLRQTHIMQEYGKKMVRLLNFDTGRIDPAAVQIPLIGRINLVQNPDAVQFITMLAESAAGDFVIALM